MSKTPNFIRRHIDLSITEHEMDNFIKDTKLNRDATLIAPFVLFLGAVKNTNYGEVKNVEPATQTTFQQIFSGQDDVLAVWEDSTTSKLDENNDTLPNEEKNAAKVFNVGRTLKGMMSSEQGLSTFAKKQDPSLADFTTQQAAVSVSIIFEDPQITFNDLFKFYVIPQSGTNQYLYISQLITYKDPTGRSFQEAIFSSVNDLLESTGSAVSQYIQNIGVGSAYAFPAVEYVDDENNPDSNEKIIKFKLNPNKLKGVPATSIQIEIFGPAILLGLNVMGRPSKGDNKIYAPRLLGYSKFETPILSTITNKQTGENNYKIIYDAEVEVVKYWSDWKEKIKSLYEDGAKQNYEGLLLTDKDKTDATNSGETYYDSWNTGWTHQQDGGVISTPENRMTEGTITYQKGAKLSDHLVAMGVALMGQLRLPIGVKETTIWNLKDIPIIGPFASIFTLGIPVGWQNTDEVINGKKISGFIPATLYDFISNINVVSDDQGAIALDAFRDNESDEISSILGTSTTSLALKMRLTDKANKPNAEGVIETKNTIDIGQDGGWLLDGNEVWQDPNLEVNEGYEIDIIDPIILGKADYKITIFNGDQEIYQSVHQSRAKFTDSIREIHNPTKTSNWEEIDSKISDYPQAIPDPLPPSVQYPNLSTTIDINATADADNGESITEMIINPKSAFGMSWDEIVSAGYRYLKVQSSYRHKWEGYGDTGNQTITKTIPIADINQTNDTIIMDNTTHQVKGKVVYIMKTELQTGWCSAGFQSTKDSIGTEESKGLIKLNEDNNLVITASATSDMSFYPKAVDSCGFILKSENPDGSTTINKLTISFSPN